MKAIYTKARFEYYPPERECQIWPPSEEATMPQVSSLVYPRAIVDSVSRMLSVYVLHVLDLEYCGEHFHSCQLRWWGSGTLHLPWCFDSSSAATWNSHCNCTHLCLNTAITSVRFKKHQVSAALLHFANDELPSPFLSFVRKSYVLMMYDWLVNFLSIQQPVCMVASAICPYEPLVII